MPGGIDVHTHLDMPFGGTTSADDYFTGTRAAAIGGTTTVFDFALQSRGSTLQAALATWNEKPRGKACVDYSPPHGHYRPRPRPMKPSPKWTPWSPPASPASNSSWPTPTSS